MTVKGQITVPKDLRDAFGWKVGDEVAFVKEDAGVRVVRAAARSRGQAVVERSKRAPWNRQLTTDRLMAMTRGRRGDPGRHQRFPWTWTS
jgi:AbrB family looped-hinge helix DNA binding protein